MMKKFNIGDRVKILNTNSLIGVNLPIVGKTYNVVKTLGWLFKVEGFEEGGTWLADHNVEVISCTPLKKITQSGYEYSLVGPVKPEWLVDGAWVVDTDNGEKRIVVEERPGVFNLCVNSLASIRYHDGIRNQYRAHEPKDWKWGDWAMYDGKRVFVMCGVDSNDEVGISFPNIDKYGDKSGDKNWNYVSESELTPTF